MIPAAGFAHITADARVPEQLVHYVRAVSGRKPLFAAGHVAYLHDDHAVLVAYPEFEPGSVLHEAAAEETAPVPGFSLAPALEVLRQYCGSVTVLAPFVPREAPPDTSINRDCYWQIPLPLAKSGTKLRNMLRRADRDVSLHEESWSPEHEALVNRYLATRVLEPGTRKIYSALSAYVATGGGMYPEARISLLGARRKEGGLAAFALGDFSGLHTAFYMAAFRYEDAPPGTADLLLQGLIARAEISGHARMNLGLGINPGVAFFKRKWGAAVYLPYVESSWAFSFSKKSGKSLLRRLFKR